MSLIDGYYWEQKYMKNEKEKQSPKRIQRKKVHNDGTTEVWAEYFCPHCNKMIAKGFSPHYPHCMWCGNQVEWGNNR